MWKIYSERAIADVYIQPRATTRWGAAKIGLAHSLRMSFTAKDQLSAGQAIA
jgi:hypothetical protein